MSDKSLSSNPQDDSSQQRSLSTRRPVMRVTKVESSAESEEFRALPLPENYPVCLMIRESQYRQILDQTFKAAPLDRSLRNETGGLLAGQVFRETDSNGTARYRVYIREFHQIGVGTASEFTISGQNWAEAGPHLGELSKREGNRLEWVGVVHSHPGFGIFHSKTDENSLGKSAGLLIDDWNFSLVVDHLTYSPHSGKNKGRHFQYGYAGIFFDNDLIQEFGLEEPFPELAPSIESGTIDAKYEPTPSLAAPAPTPMPSPKPVPVSMQAVMATHATDSGQAASGAGKEKPEGKKQQGWLHASPLAALLLVLSGAIAVSIVQYVQAHPIHLPSGPRQTQDVSGKLLDLKVEPGDKLKPTFTCTLDAKAVQQVEAYKKRAPQGESPWRLEYSQHDPAQPEFSGDLDARSQDDPSSNQRTFDLRYSLEQPGRYRFRVVAKSGDGQPMPASDWSDPQSLERSGALKFSAKPNAKKLEATSTHYDISLTWTPAKGTELTSCTIYRKKYPTVQAAKDSSELKFDLQRPNIQKLNLNPRPNANAATDSLSVSPDEKFKVIRYWIVTTNKKSGEEKDTDVVRFDFKSPPPPPKREPASPSPSKPQTTKPVTQPAGSPDPKTVPDTLMGGEKKKTEQKK